MIATLYLLPQSVVADLVSSWLCLQELGRLDSAVCRTNVRPMMVESLCLVPLRHTENDPRINRNFAEWMTKRKILLRELFVEKEFGTLNKYLESKFLLSVGATIRGITIDPSYDHHRVDHTVLTLCSIATNLEVCIVKPKISDAVVAVMLAMHARIRVLSLKSDDDLLSHIAGHDSCAHLTELTIAGNLFEESLHSFLELDLPKLQKLSLPEGVHHAIDGPALAKLQLFQNLTTLHIAYLRPAELQGLSFPNITELRVMLNYEDYSPFAMSPLPQAFPNLTVLIVDGCNRPQDLHTVLLVIALFPQLIQLTQWSRDMWEPLDADRIAASSTIRSRRVQAIGAAQFPLQTLQIFAEKDAFDVEQLMALCPVLCELGFCAIPNFGNALQNNIGSILRLCAYSPENLSKNAAVICGLQELLILDGRELTTANLETLARNNPQLRVLCIKKLSTKISCRGLMAFLDHCPQLTSVTFMVEKAATTVRYGEVDYMLRKWCGRLYPKLKRLECNLA